MKKTTIKALIAEGLPPSLVMSIKPEHKMSPCILNHGDEPVEVLRAGRDAFYVLDEEGFVKDGATFFTAKAEAVMAGRVRYLHVYGEQERAVETLREMERRRKQAERVLENIEREVRGHKIFLGTDIPMSGPEVLLLQSVQLINGKHHQVKAAEDFFQRWPTIEEDIFKVRSLLNEEGGVASARIILGIDKPSPGEPMMTAQLDSPSDMMHLKNVFGAAALESAFSEDGKGMEQIISAVEVEKRYT